MEPRLIFIVGCTASGKGSLGRELARRAGAEIISIDSMKVYRGMDIGTAKPSRELLARAPHHLIDLLDPAERYSAARFVQDAHAAMAAIAARGRVPLLAGGTMLYFRALQSGLASLPAADPAVRRRLDERAEIEGWPALHAELARLDPAAASRIRPNDRQRIQRALEVIERSGRPLTEQLAEDLRGAAREEDLPLVLAPSDRALQAARLQERFEGMLRQGLLEEVRALYTRGDLHAGLPSMRLIGYRQLWQHLEGSLTLDEAATQAVAATRQLARRQLTWLRAEPRAEWFDAGDAATRERMAARVAEWLENRGFSARRC